MSETFNTALEESFLKFRNHAGKWSENSIGPKQMLSGFFIYAFRTFFDKYGIDIFPQIPDAFLENLRDANKSGIALEGSDITTKIPSIRIGVPGGSSKHLELGLNSPKESGDAITHQKWVGSIDILVSGRNNLEAAQMADVVELAVTGPLSDLFVNHSLYVNGINSPKPKQKVISNDITGWEVPMVLNFELVSIGMTFELVYPILQEIQLAITLN